MKDHPPRTCYAIHLEIKPQVRVNSVIFPEIPDGQSGQQISKSCGRKIYNLSRQAGVGKIQPLVRARIFRSFPRTDWTASRDRHGFSVLVKSPSLQYYSVSFDVKNNKADIGASEHLEIWGKLRKGANFAHRRRNLDVRLRQLPLPSGRANGHTPVFGLGLSQDVDNNYSRPRK